MDTTEATARHDDESVHVHHGGHVHIDHHVYIHAHADESAHRMLEQILARLGAIERQEIRIMTDVAGVKQIVSDMNDETNTIAAKVDAQNVKIDELKAQVAAGGTVSQQDLDDIGAGLTGISARLKTIGSDPTTPIPPVDPNTAAVRHRK